MIGVVVYVLIIGVGWAEALWIAVLTATAVFLIAMNWKTIKKGGQKLAVGFGYIFLFGLFTAMALGVIWGIVAIIHWAWRNS